jgi:hypothetical protein
MDQPVTDRKWRAGSGPTVASVVVAADVFWLHRG